MTFYYVLTGRLAYRARNRQELAVAFKEHIPQLPSHFNPDVKRDLDSIVMKMITIDIDKRYQSVGDVISALQDATRGHRRSSREPRIAIRTILIASALLLLFVVALIMCQFKDYLRNAQDANSHHISSGGIAPTPDIRNNVREIDSAASGLSGREVRVWGAKGSDGGQFNRPYLMDVGPDKLIYVTDDNNHRVQAFTLEGQFVTQWGTKGTGTGQFVYPSGIAVDSEGLVYVADKADRIQKFARDGTFIMQWGDSGGADGQFRNPKGIAAHMSFLYVADLDNNRIQKFTTNGQWITKWGTYGSEQGQFHNPYGVDVDVSGNVYVADYRNHRIQKFTEDGLFLTSWGGIGSNDGQFHFVRDVAIDASGFVYTAGNYNHRIQKFTGDGNFIAQWGSLGTDVGQFDYPFGIATDLSGNVYVADGYNCRIVKLGSHHFSQFEAVLYDSFDDGDYTGWSTEAVLGYSKHPPEVVPSPEGYSLRGTGKGYVPDWSCVLSRRLDLRNAVEISLEMRARSGPELPNEASVYLISGQDSYKFTDYGEGHKSALLVSQVDYEEDKSEFPIGQEAFQWHTLCWKRNEAGWWSLSIDGDVRAEHLKRDTQLVDFDYIQIQLHRDQSEIEWLRVCAKESASG